MRPNNQNKTGYYEDLFNRLAHYNHLLEASDSRSRKEELEQKGNPHVQHGHSRFDSKLYKSAEKERKTNNSILLKKLVAIHKKKPVPESDRYDDIKRREGRSLQYRSLEADRELQKQNKELTMKILKSKPKIGNHNEWDQHYSRFITNERKLSRVAPELMMLDSQFYSTYTDLYSRGSQHRISLQSEGKQRTASHTKPGTSVESAHPCLIHGSAGKPTTAAVESFLKKQDEDLVDPLPDTLDQPIVWKPAKRRRKKKKDSTTTTAQLYVLGTKGSDQIYQRLLEEYDK